MVTYELTYCFKPTLDPDSIEGAITGVEGYIKNLEGTILKTEKMGRKRLAFEIKKFKDGFYALTYFKLDPEKITDLRKSLKLNENIIRTMILKLEKPEKNPKYQKSMESSDAPSTPTRAGARG